MQRVEREGTCWLLETEVNGDSNSTSERDLLALSCRCKRFLFCLGCSSQPSSNFLFLFKFLCPHRPASLAGRPLVQYVSLEVTKERPLSNVLRESSYKYHFPTHRYPFLSGWRQVRQVGRKHSSLKIPTIMYSLHYFGEQLLHILVHVRTGRGGPGKRVIYCLQIRFTHYNY